MTTIDEKGGQFLCNARIGESKGWQYGFVLVGVVVYWLHFSYFTMAMTQWLLSAVGVHEMIARMVGEASPFAVIIIWLLWANSRLHKRHWRSLINADSAVSYRRVAQGFLVWGLLLSVWTSMDFIANPSHYRFDFDLMSWSLLFVLSICLVPIQTSAEELLYRGYMMQGLRLLTRRSFAIVAISSLAFAIPHFSNPEMARGDFIWGALSYFAWGVIFAVITIKDNGLELALGVHAANNLFSYLFVTTPDSVVYSPAVWIYEAHIDPRLSLLGLLADGAIFYVVFFGGISRSKIAN